MQPSVCPFLLPAAALALCASPLLADGDGACATAWLSSDAAVIGLSLIHI